MILAGGLSSRLYPLTRDTPKPLVPLLNRPVMAHVIEYLASSGVRDIMMNVHYHADAIVQVGGNGSQWDVELHYLREEKLSGSAGAVKKAAAHFTSTFVVATCDTVSTVDLSAAFDFHVAHQAKITVVLAPAPDPSQCGVAVTNGADRIVAFQEKPTREQAQSAWCNSGIYILEPSILEQIPFGVQDFGSQLFPAMADRGAPIFGMRQQAYWCDLGSPETYRRAHFDALAGKIQLRPGEGSRIVNQCLIGCNTRINAAAHIVPPCCIGDNCQIDAGCWISGSILWNGVHVEGSATIEGAVVARPLVSSASVLRGGEYV